MSCCTCSILLQVLPFIDTIWGGFLASSEFIVCLRYYDTLLLVIAREHVL